MWHHCSKGFNEQPVWLSFAANLDLDCFLNENISKLSSQIVHIFVRVNNKYIYAHEIWLLKQYIYHFQNQIAFVLNEIAFFFFSQF